MLSRYRLDPEIAAVLEPMAASAGEAPPIERGDWRALRERANTNLAFLATLNPPVSGAVSVQPLQITVDDGTDIAARWYKRSNERPGSAVVYAHGGGMIAGNLDVYDAVVAEYVAATGVPFLSVAYRLAPEAQGPRPARDVFAAVQWLSDLASELGVEPNRIAVMGDSGGGGVAASAAIIARDLGVGLARQILIYPMLDDRTLDAGAVAPFLTWTSDMNFTGWSARLGEQFGADGVLPASAPARLTNFRGLASAYIEVGDLDIFRSESVSYAQQLAAADVPIELHVHPGAPHGFERFAPASQLAQRAMHDRKRAIRSL
ncbi:MAG TPA: alpha/beta hydrolase [Candidatus Angelobacter sp.]|nr:alpha/beta hydrolase [Candidatus Angelobacter sp.]